jgi:retron-type reverse transcriptase
MVETTGNRKMQIHTTDKPFNITKKQVYEAYKAVKSKAGAAGVDRQTIEQFDSNVRGNLYKLWNRMSSGSYFPPPVRAVFHSQEEWRPADFRCAHRSGSGGSDGCQTNH